MQTIRRKKGGFIAFERITPRSHTDIRLSSRGARAFKALSPEEQRKFALDLTGGGGFSTDHGVVLHISHDNTPVYKRWPKIHKLLREGESKATGSVSPSEFREWQKKHRNLMTPTTVRIYRKGKHVIEVSKGRGLKGGIMYGVTKITKTNGGFKTSDVGNKLFQDDEDAKRKALAYAKKRIKGIF